MKPRARDRVRPVLPAAARSVAFRADADAITGAGHVMRCLALAQALQDMRVPVFFIAASLSPAIRDRLSREGIRVVPVDAVPGSPPDAAATCAEARNHGASWVVIDGYRHGEAYERQLKESGLSVLRIDDTGMQGPYTADIILNQNVYASREMYAGVHEDTQLLLGSRYALLRREFLAAREEIRHVPETAARILVTLGGSDPDNRTRDVISAVMRLPRGSCEVRAIAGGCSPHYPDLVSLMQGSEMTLLHDVDDMAEHCRWADIAICGGGSTTLELACLGVPMVTVAIAENQVPVCAALEKAGAAVNAGAAGGSSGDRILELLETLIPSKEARAGLSHRAQRLVDGRGSHRVALCLCEDAVVIRHAVPADCDLIFAWINEPYVRQQSFHTEPIPYREHTAWFLAKMEDRASRYYIVNDRNGTPVGQVRYDVTGTEAIISILIAPKHRGHNYGTLAMRRTSRILFEETGVTVIHAYVRKTNPVSCRAFASAGFVPAGMILRRNTEAYHLVLRRP